jgi:hypothetical protein
MAENTSADVGKILSTIREVESNNNYTIGSKSSSASGAYQFIDDTWRRYTNKFGVGSEYPRAKDAPPEVQDQVASLAVSDILRQVGGDVSKVPLVWYTGNPQGQMTEAALKANQGLTPDKYQQKWLSVFNKGATTKVAQAPAQAPRTTAPEPRTTKPGVQVAASFNPMELPASYTSALALNYLSDTDPEGVTMSKVNEMLADMIEDGGGAATRKTPGAAVLQQYAQGEQADPFQIMRKAQEAGQPQRRTVPKMPQTPQMFALGGSVSSLAKLTSPTLLPSEKAYLKAQQEEADRYNKAVEDYNARAEAYRKSLFLEGDTARIYEKSANRGGWTGNVLDPATGQVYAPGQYYLTQDGDFLLARQNPTNVIDLQTRSAGKFNTAYIDPRTGQTVAESNQSGGIAYGPNYFVQGGKLYEFAAEPTGPEPTTTLDTAKVEQYQKDAARRAAQRNAALKYAMGVAPQGTSGVSGFSFGFADGGPVGQMASAQPIEIDGFANGGIVYRQAGSPPTGEVADIAEQMTVGTIPTEGQTPAGQAFRNIGRDVVRGAQYLPYDLLGAPVDIINMGLTPFGLSSQRPVGGSEYLIEKARQAGIADQPTGSAAETATRIGMGFVNPAAVARQIPKGIAALEKGVESMTLPAFRQITGNPNATREEMMDFVLNQRNIMQAGAPAAVKPSGGAVQSQEMTNALSKTAELDLGIQGQKLEDILDWIDTKAKTYYERQYGSPSDPLFKAFEKEEFMPTFNPPVGSARHNFYGIDLESAMQDISEARRLIQSNNPVEQNIGRELLSKTYDYSTPIVAKYGPKTFQNRLMNPRYRDEIKQYISEELNLGPKDLSAKGRLDFDKAMDASFDEFVKTGRVPDNALFTENDLLKAATENLVDDIASKIYVQKGVPAYNTLSQRNSIYDPRFPDWTATQSDLQAVKYGDPVYFIPGKAEETHVDMRNLLGYMNRTPSEEWKNTSFADLVVKAQKDYANITDPQEIYKRIDNYQKVTPKQRLIGTSEFMPVQSETLGKGASWRELDEDGMMIEGRLLKHCLSEDEKYANFYKNGTSRFFALRDNEGKSHATIQIDRLGMTNDGPFANVHQIKGWKNDPVGKKYDKEIMDFLNRFEAQEAKVPLRFTEDSSYLPPSLGENLRVRSIEGDSPFILRQVEFLRNLDRELIAQNKVTPEDLGDFNYILDRLREVPDPFQQESFLNNFLQEFADGIGMTLKDIYKLGGRPVGRLEEPQPVWQNPPQNRARGGMVDKPLYDRAM